MQLVKALVAPNGRLAVAFSLPGLNSGQEAYLEIHIPNLCPSFQPAAARHYIFLSNVGHHLTDYRDPCRHSPIPNTFIYMYHPPNAVIPPSTAR
jgi:hypothetical protein